jgi:hypothetical protein
MACEFKWQKACQIDNSLPIAENWVEKLTLRQIANLRFPDSKDGSDKKALLKVLDNRVENGSLEFDDVEIFSEWHFPDVTVIFPSYGHHDEFLRSMRQQDRENTANQFLAAHKPTCGWVVALKEVKQGDSITLKQHLCQCHCTCELIKSFHNGLPRKWKVTGEHEVTEEHKNGLKVNFSCKAIPIITAKQCYDVFNLINLPIPENSVLHGWWEGDIEQSSAVNNRNYIKTDGKALFTKDAPERKLNAYEQRKISFTTWLNASPKKLDNFKTVEAIFEEVKNTGDKTKKGKPLWDNPNSFKRDFWQKYCKEISYKRKKPQ